MVRVTGQRYEQVAARIQAAANLRAIADGLTQRSDAVDEVQTKARKVAGQIERAHGRYAATGAALVTYSASLAQAQQIAQDALRQAQSAAAAQDNAQQELCYWSRRSSEVLPGQPAVDFTSQVDTARQNLFQTDRHLDQARATLGTATMLRDDAGEAARASIYPVDDAGTKAQSVTVIGWDDCTTASFSKEFDTAGAVLTQCVIGASVEGGNEIAGVMWDGGALEPNPYDKYEGKPLLFMK